MPLTPSTVIRTDDTSGDNFRTFETGGVKSQGVALVDDSGAHAGIAGVPVITQEEPPTTTPFSSGASDVVSYVLAGAGTLRQLRAFSSNASTVLYVHIFLNTGTVGTDPDWVMILPPQGESSESFEDPLVFNSSGCTIGLSTTRNTYTAASAEALFIGART